jgi:hypothetical protein
MKYREPLSARGSIAAGGLRWYELVRKRDERWLTARKLVTRDLATQTSFALDSLGGTYLVGGTAVVPADPDLALVLLGYLNSSIVNEFMGQITPTFKRGFQKIEPQHLQRVPVLSALLNGGDLAVRLGELVSEVVAARAERRIAEQRSLEDAIEEMLRAALEVSPAV